MLPRHSGSKLRKFCIHNLWTAPCPSLIQNVSKFNNISIGWNCWTMMSSGVRSICGWIGIRNYYCGTRVRVRHCRTRVQVRVQRLLYSSTDSSTELPYSSSDSSTSTWLEYSISGFDGCKKLITSYSLFFLINVNCCCVCDARLSNYRLRMEGDKRTKTRGPGRLWSCCPSVNPVPSQVRKQEFMQYLGDNSSYGLPGPRVLVLNCA